MDHESWFVVFTSRVLPVMNVPLERGLTSILRRNQHDGRRVYDKLNANWLWEVKEDPGANMGIF